MLLALAVLGDSVGCLSLREKNWLLRAKGPGRVLSVRAPCQQLLDRMGNGK